MRVSPLLPPLLALLTPGLLRGQEEEPLVPRAERVALRGVASGLSKAGEAEAVEHLHALLLRCGDAPDDLARLRKTWDRNLARSSRGKSLRSALGKLRDATADLAELLEERDEPERTRLAELVLALDSHEPRANAVVGRVQHDGGWVTPAEVEREEERRRIAELVQEAHRYDVHVETGTSASHVFETLFEEKGVYARFGNVTLHARTDAPKLERILRQSMRALALSSVLLTDVLTVPALKGEYAVLLMDSEQAYDDALAEARDNGGLAQADYDRNVRENMRSFSDRRGWRTSRWRTEADHQALVLWLLIEEALGPLAQPCLVAGHLNWLSLNFLGTSMPLVSWRAAAGPDPGAARTTAKKQASIQTEALWRSARRTLYGCRSWMIRRVGEGRDPPWSRSLVDHLGKVTDENLLKSTLIVDYLQERGDFPVILAETRQREDRIAAFEAALGAPLPVFEEQWRTWLLGEEATSPGLLQLLEDPPAADDDPVTAALLAELNGIRRAALAGQWPEFEAVALDAELSAGALSHARYLDLNEEQKQAWPDAHEEYADREGFTPEGSRAGLGGVIAFTDDPVDALAQWMATFYHRLPLLNPGMFGVGYGQANGVAVLDTSSLVLQPWRDHWVMWPPEGMKDVPRAWQPELPNPVPGEDQDGWGYPVTLQLFFVEQDLVLDVALRLHEGGPDGPEVDCWFLSPPPPTSASWPRATRGA